MGSILMWIVRGTAAFLAGVGVTSMVDKFIPDKLPAYPKEGSGLNFTNIPKLVWIGVFMVLGFVIISFAGKKFNIKLLK